MIAWVSPSNEKQQSYTKDQTQLGIWEHFKEPENHRMIWAARDLKNHLVSTPLPRVGTLFTSRLLKPPYNLTLNSSNNGICTTLLDNLSQCLTALKKQFLLPPNHFQLKSGDLSPVIKDLGKKSLSIFLMIHHQYFVDGAIP